MLVYQAQHNSTNIKNIGLGKVQRLRKVVCDNIKEIIKPAIPRLARRGGVKRISGLIFLDIMGRTRIRPKAVHSPAAVATTSSVKARVATASSVKTAKSPKYKKYKAKRSKTASSAAAAVPPARTFFRLLLWLRLARSGLPPTPSYFFFFSFPVSSTST